MFAITNSSSGPVDLPEATVIGVPAFMPTQRNAAAVLRDLGLPLDGDLDRNSRSSPFGNSLVGQRIHRPAQDARPIAIRLRPRARAPLASSGDYAAVTETNGAAYSMAPIR